MIDCGEVSSGFSTSKRPLILCQVASIERII